MRRIDKEFKKKSIHVERMLENLFEWDVLGNSTTGHDVEYKLYHLNLGVCDDPFINNINIAWSYDNTFSLFMNSPQAAFQFKDKTTLIRFIEIFSEANINISIQNIIHTASPFLYTASYTKEGISDIEAVLFSLIEIKSCTKQFIEEVQK